MDDNHSQAAARVSKLFRDAAEQAATEPANDAVITLNIAARSAQRILSGPLTRINSAR